MGNVEKRYCDWNGESLNGVSYNLRLTDASGTVPANVVVLDLCGACYGLFQTYLKDRKDTIATAWVLNPAVIVKLSPK